MKLKAHKITPAVFVVLIDKNERVLLHRRYRTGYMDGFYTFPSGHLEMGESLQVGAARELLEETGLTRIFHRKNRLLSGNKARVAAGSVP